MERLMNNQTNSGVIKKSYVLLMVLWSLITMGSYIGLWFVQRRKDIEKMDVNHHISFALWKIFTIISFAFLLMQLFGGMILSEVGLLTVDSIDIMYSFLFVSLLYYSVFRLRESIEEHTELELNLYALFFLHIFYIQYKINLQNK